MTTIPRVVLAGLAVTLVSLFACHQAGAGKPPGNPPTVTSTSGPGHGHLHGQEKDRPFKISIYTDHTDPTHPNQCFADYAEVTLWKAKTQTVTWFSDDNGSYRVDFNGANGNPFIGTNPYPVNDETMSRALKDNAAGHYTYTIEDGSGTPCNSVGDPVIYVK
jgi:hypothetical protein